MRLNRILRSTASAATVGAVVFRFASAAAAQEQQTGPTSVDDIIVTAQKREQSLQDVPIVVTSLSQEVLQNAGVRDIKDMQILTPGMTVTSTQSEASTTVRIRGVGTVGDNPGLESSVGVVIDGVYRSRNGVGFGDLGEMSRIEVLKGPQGTLFGKNTSAGVVNIITEPPSFNPGYNAEFTVGNYNALGAAGSVTGPINDKLAMRLYTARRVRDGYNKVDLGDGPRTNLRDQNQDFWTARGQLLWLPDDNTSLRLILDYTKRDEYCCTGVQVRTGQTFPFIDGLSNGTGQRPPNANFSTLPFSRIGFANRDTTQRVEDKGISLEGNFNLNRWGDATLTSVTSARRWTSVNGMDIDYTGADIIYRAPDGHYGFNVDNFTQEFRLAGATERLDWLVGVFATHEKIDRADSYVYGADYNPFLSFLLSAALNRAVPAFPITGGGATAPTGVIGCFTRTAQTPLGLQQCLGTGGAVSGSTLGYITGDGVRDQYDQKSDSFAIFTNNTFHLTEKLDVTLGLRYTYDKKTLDGHQTNLNGNGGVCAAAKGNAAVIGGVLGAAGSSIIGNLCLPWANNAYNDRRISEEKKDGELSGTVKAAYRLSPELMTYVSYARGYKSFGYNLDRVQSGVTPNASLLFPSELVDSYEAGFKATLFNRKVLFNATYFDQKVTDFQLNTFLGTAFVVESIPELKTRGVDADFLWFTPVEGLTLSAGATYTDASYGHFVASQLTSPGNFPQLSLLPGNTPAFAPEWSLTSSVNFDRSIGNGLRAGFSLSAKYSSEYNTGSDLLPFKQQEALTLLNGRISFGAENENWTIEVWGQNITDEQYMQVGYAAPLQGTAFQTTVQPNGTYYNPALDTATYNAYLGQPRTFGATLRLKY